MKKVTHWRILKRLGILFILFGITSLSAYNFLPLNYSENVISPIPQFNQGNTPSVMLFIQRNQYLEITSSCSSCIDNVIFQVSILRINNNNYLDNTSIENIFLSFNKTANKIVSLNPGSYFILFTLQGNSSVSFTVLGYGIPFFFIFTNINIIIIGTILILLDRKKILIT
jgi:hypothetical protein